MFSFIKLVNFFSVLHRLITHRLIPALVCFLLCISNTQAQTQQAIGYGGISDFVKHDQSTIPSPSITNSAEFGSAIVDIGDIDGDDVDDLVVGGHLRNVTGAGQVGSIYILRMTTENTVKGISEITHGAGDIQLKKNDRFGTSLANIGDFDGDGINELAVGTGGGPRGVMYILHLTASGGLKRSSTIDFNDINNILGNDDLDDGDRFGASIANMGDIDGDGIIDLAVGAFLDDERFGSVHILFMNNTGNSPTLKAAAKIDTSGLTAVSDFFGISVANIGDLNGDRINDLAVGAFVNNGTYGTNQGAVHVFLLNRDGSRKADNFEIFDTNGNIFSLSGGDNAGRSIANLGDLNGDGINDIAVGAIGVDPGTTGAVFTIFMNRMKDQITAADIPRITHNSLPDLNLPNSGRFGFSVANIGDRNRDGINDIAVGAASEDGTGSFYILHMDAETVITDVTAAADRNYGISERIDIQVIFSEAVDVAGTPSLSLDTGTSGSEATYTGGSGSHTLTFAYTVATGDSATDLDYVSTMSLTLNSGTINAAATPNHTALLTLPEPGSRGSLSANRNLSINSGITNTVPTGPTQNLDQELTVNTPFTYTIPAGAFNDDQNDALTYTASALPGSALPGSALPAWLSLDSDTGAFSGTPTTDEDFIVRLTISDGTLSITADISITVNPAPTLPTIDDKNYSLSQPISSIVLPEAAEGTGTFIYTLSPVLADGLMFNPVTRELSGTAPATESTGQYTYTAEDENGALAAQIFTITVKAPPTLNSISDKVYFIGNTINEQLPAATEGTGPFTYALSPVLPATTLPDGLMFDTGTRIISGIPEKAGQHIEYTYTATDSSLPVANEVSTNFSITIVAEAINSLPAKWNGHIFDIVKHGQSPPDIPIPNNINFGASIVNIGDINNDETDDLVVGGSKRAITGVGNEVGGIYILRMNADNTVQAFSQIIHMDTGGIRLEGKSNFGISMANIGDFDNDGINELAVGGLTGMIYIIHLTASGELKRFYTLDFNDVNNILGNNGLDNDDRFGGSIANLGDIDGDGIIDLAVGAFRDDEDRSATGDEIGSVHILFMERIGNNLAIKAAAKVDTTTLGLGHFDAFGISVANIGDLNQDGINDLAVGAPGNHGNYGDDQGAAYVFLLNRDGSIKSGGFEIFDTGTNNIFDLSGGDQVGGAIANLGDLNGDGINDIAVGGTRIDGGGISNAGAVFTVLMKRTKDQITADDFSRITHNSLPDLILERNDFFGSSIANIGDRNGDGINDIAVGASGDGDDSIAANNTGAFYILHMDAETVITAVTASAANGRHNTNALINIQVIFSEPVEVDTSGGTPWLLLQTESAVESTAAYTIGSGSDTLTFAYTVAAGDSATDLDYVNTMSLTLNGGTISAAATPNRTALLTLPAPESRGSLSSNKNLAINELAITNAPPTEEMQIPDQVLTIGTSFIYTIPAGTFADAENDPLRYIQATLPSGLSLDSYTGTFSGTPIARQASTQYLYRISDGENLIIGTINIAVNLAPTLTSISDKNYSLSQSISPIVLPEAAGGTGLFIYTLSPLTDDLMFNPATRQLSGTVPATEQTRKYTYTAEDENGALAVRIFTITVRTPPTLNSISDKAYSIGNTINEQLPAATEGTGPFTYELSPSSLPDGLMFDTGTRIISGIPTKAGQHIEYTYTATDSSLPVANEVSTNFSITIAEEAISSLLAQGNGHISDFVKYDKSNFSSISSNSRFGGAVTNIGDIDENGTDDLAVGAPEDDNNTGAVYILLMEDDRISTNTVIRNGTSAMGCATTLTANSFFGVSLANIGDFDNDGINELAVGVLDNGIRILHLTASGQLDCFSAITFSDINNILGENNLDNTNDRVGASLANLGDIDGNGIIDLAVGAHRDDNRGSVHILFMDKIGNTPALKAAIKIDTSGFDVVNTDFFGLSVAGIGDLDQDGINDLAVGAISNDGNHGTNQGAVHVFLLNRDGSIKPGGFEIFDTGASNIFSLNGGEQIGRAIANLGDLNGDGINDIAVGAPGVDSGTINDTGAVFTIFMERAKNQFTADDIVRITHNIPLPGLTLSAEDIFGTSIANIGDRNGDGINDIAVGATGANPGGDTTGALYILYMDAETVITAVTAAAANGRHNTNALINIQVIFSEAVDVGTGGGTPSLILETGNSDTEVIYTSGSGSDTLIFAYTVAVTDRAADLDYVSATSLSLNGGTIIATEAPNSSASLTLPQPGSRGSLSANRNLAINMTAITNTAPTEGMAIPNQALTVNIPFTYTIPAEAFNDNQNDALTYTSSALPGWLSLDPITGTFSGTPTTAQNFTITLTVSDGEFEIEANINIAVNSAPTLTPISDEIYFTSQPITTINLPAATNGTEPFTYTLSPVLPGNLMFNAAARTITGTAPATEHTGQYTYTAEDENGALTAQTFTITIEALQALNISNKIYSIGDSINEQLPATTGGTGTITYALSPATLPDGLRYDVDTRTISGIPETVGQYIEYTYTATPSSFPAGNISTNFSITIVAETISPFPAKGTGHISDIIKYDQSNFAGILANSEFGGAVINMGDIDGNGVDDLAVGAPKESLPGALSRGAVRILLMNADDTIKSHTVIMNNSRAIECDSQIVFNRNSDSGVSLANIGDFDNDGINELIVGTTANRIHILHLTEDGELDCFSRITFSDINNILGENSLDGNDRVGVSMANLGDIDGDGIIDLAVGAHRDDGTGSVHILFMDETGGSPVLKAAAKIDTSGLIANGDLFGFSVANIGDLNQDGINDLAVGATSNDGNHGNNQGAVHIFLLNRDGSINPGGFEIFDTGASNIFSLNTGDQAGRAIANLGDFNGDGINDIAVGAIGVDSGTINDTGAVFTIFMERAKNQFTTDDIFIINGTHPDLTLSAADMFGTSIANIGDRNGDGINDIAVGAPDTDPGTTGALYILYMDAETVITAVTAAAANGRHNTNALINIQVVFSEAVDVDTSGGTPSLTLETGSSDTEVIYTSGSGSDTLTFAYTVAGTDRATDLDYVSTASLTLNGGTIIATEAPNSSALLTLPEPGSRGSLSANKNLAINEIAPGNTAPMQEMPIPALEITAGTTITYTIPAGTFTDAENDPLIYTSTNLPGWLSLDSDTGTFSGAPPTDEDHTISLTISDGEFEIEANISIIVNPAPTLTPIEDRAYSPNESISITLPVAGGGTGTGHITYTLSPAPIDGLTFQAGTLIGTVSTDHTGQYTYTAEDENGALAAQTFTITIKTLQVPNISNKIYPIGNPVNEQLPAATGGTGSISYTLSPATLPERLMFDDGTRTISGIPTRTALSAQYTYTATDSSSPAIDVSTKFSIIIATEAGPFPAKGNGHISDVFTYNITDNFSFRFVQTHFGSSVADIGDIDGDGVNDLAVGASGLSPGDGSTIRFGGVYIFLMNDDGTVKGEPTQIINPVPSFRSDFGISLANIGDFDDDGINELAVGVLNRNRIDILHLTASGQLNYYSTIHINDVNALGNSGLGGNDRFGVSIANLGDIDGDEINDLAVGAFRDDSVRGSVHILFMNKTGGSPTLKRAVKIGTNDLNLTNGDAFGISVANIGDLNQDGINDLAVGAQGDDEGGTNQGAVHILLLNSDGSIKPDSFKITDIFGLNAEDNAGRSIANLGDLNGDGINDIAVGAIGVDPGTTGAVFTVFMNRMKDQITGNRITHPDLNLSANSEFGTSIANIGDRNGDGINDIAVGAIKVGVAGLSETGRLYILHMDAETIIIAVTATTDDRHNEGETINIQVIFSEAVDVNTNGGTPSLTLKTGEDSTASAIYSGGSGSNILAFEYTVVSTDEVKDLDYVSTMSLTLNGGTIVAVETPSQPASLTLPTPESKGSLSSNRGLSLNTDPIINTAPRRIPGMETPIQNLTVGTPFTYTIPTGTFIDDQNDALIYTLSAPSGWLMLHPNTGEFTGTPPTAQALTPYEYTVSDGDLPTTDNNIRIIVNAAPVLPPISDETYSPGQTVDITLPTVVTGGTGMITYTLPSGLPNGLTFTAAARTITGTVPAMEQTTEHIYAAVDENGARSEQRFRINILKTQYGGISNIEQVDISSISGISTNSRFGSAVTNIGDIDKNGTDYLAVGAPEDGQNKGAVHILRMNADDTIASHTVIRNNTFTTDSGCAAGNNIALADNSYFGVSLANIGDFDNDGINELAVGATAGRIYILHLTENDEDEIELDCFSTIDFNNINNILGVNSSDPDSLDGNDRFGVSIANLGDIDGDGIIDLAVGAHQDDAQGSVHILFMNETTTGPELKAAIKIDTSGLGLVNDDQFGISVAGIGDLDQDGINDLAVGAILNNVPGINDQGAVHVLLLNRNGSIKSEGFEIFDTAVNIFDLSPGDRAGRSIANLGDLNGDGINDIAVGALRGDSDTITNTGAVFTIFMRRTDQFIGDDFFIINDTHPDLTLSANDEFGISIANIGDRNRDGISDIAVGAAGTGSGTTGALYILHLDTITVVRDVTAAAAVNGRYDTGAILNIQVIFSEAVEVDTSEGTPSLILETGTIDTSATYSAGSGSDTLTFAYTVAGTDRATDLDYVNTASLTLNGGTINAAATPSHTALLTLPAPGSRGSLSANKNLAINEIAITTNTPPTGPTQNLDQELTVGTPFTYTIPAGAFNDDQNDALTYTASNLPAWLSLDSDTGTFSGTPTSAPDFTVRLTISDGALSAAGTIGITVNPAPTLPTIDDQTYSPNRQISPLTLPAITGGTGTAPFTYTLSPVLPDNLTFNPVSRMITGTALAEHTGQYTYAVEDKNGALAAQTFTITVKTLQIPDISDEIYLIGNTVNKQLPTATGGTGPIRYALSPTLLPDGLMLDTGTGIISGRPTKTGQGTEYTYTATDSSVPAISVATNFLLVTVAEAVSLFPAQGNGHISDFVKYDQSNFSSISSNSRFGGAVTNIGDIDENGTDDLAVGAPEDDNNTGAVYILLMEDDRISTNTVIRNGTSAMGCAATLTADSFFGVSLANIGDFDNDGINELAVGVLDNGIRILHLTEDGELDCFSAITFSDINNILGENNLDNTNDRVGASLANLGDIDGNGIIDLAVGAHRDDNRGSVHILFMDKIGNTPALKAAIKIDTSGFDVVNTDFFGLSVAGIGDLDQDGINDLAVGAISNDGNHGTNQGAVHVFLLNRDGSIKPEGFEIFDTGASNIFSLNGGEQIGRAIANLGDLNGDGINDIAVGAPGVDSGTINDTGAVFTIFMERAKNQFTADDIVRITHNALPGLTLSAEDIFGTSIANIGDRNGDGINDIAVGATGADPDGDTGALYILYMDAETVITAVTAAAANGRHNTNALINIQVIFSEAVDVDTSGGTPTLTLETGNPDTEAIYTSGSGSNILIFAYTVAGTDIAADLDYVNTMSLSLNGGTIIATEAPNNPDFLTLPAPGSKGSLSSNKNLAINMPAITNTRPTTVPGRQIPDQALTVGIPFTYTIPTEAFADTENDPLRYTSTNLPGWLSLDPDTGTFSGTPPTTQTSTQYGYTVSDGEVEIEANISIAVNLAPTLPPISDETYSPGQSRSIQLPEAAGGTGNITYTLSPADLPGTLMFNAAARTITGAAPTVEQTKQYTYTAEDENGALAAQTFDINILEIQYGGISDIIKYDQADISSIPANSRFGSAVINIGDIDENGTDDLAVGAPEDGSNAGAVYILLMDDDTIPSTHTVIRNDTPAMGCTAGDITLGTNHYFGVSLANIGDFDNDGINELAVGATAGRIYILHLTRNGELDCFSTITFGDINDILGVTSLVGGDRFGVSVANLGDIDGDGIIDLAVGAHRDDEQGMDSGSVYILFMDKTTTGPALKAAIKIDTSGLGLMDNDVFGISVAGIGDLNQDGINDLAVGATENGKDDVNKPGTVHVLLLNRDGSIKSGGFEIFGTANDIFGLNAEDGAGRSIANLGDLNGDGINDIAVGAFGVDESASIADTGAVFTIFMRRTKDQITTSNFFRITDVSHLDFNLSRNDQFGTSIANIGDRNGDGINDIAVGAPGTDNNAGALYILHLDTITVVKDVTTAAPNRRYNTTDEIGIQVIFSEAVDVDTSAGTPSLILETGSSDTAAIYTSGSGSDTLTFAYTVAGTDIATDLDYVSTASLTLNGGTISTIPTPKQRALLTLPEPRSRGSLSSNKNLSINAEAIDNTAPTERTPIPDQTLTAGTSFTYTIPAEAFNDAENDALTYTSSALPPWLSLNPTGTFSGTPPNVQTLTPYEYTVSDGTLSTTANIRIAVNPELTFLPPAIRDRNYSPGDTILINLPPAIGGTTPTYTLSPVLPSGLTFDANATERTIKGSRAAEHTGQYTYTVEDENGALAAQTFTIAIKALQAPDISDKIYSIGDTINEQLPVATGGTGDITYELSPQLPEGLTFSTPTRTISGILGKTGRSAEYTYTAMDSSSPTPNEVSTTFFIAIVAETIGSSLAKGNGHISDIIKYDQSNFSSISTDSKFGGAVINIGDIDGNRVLAVGAPEDGSNAGAVYILLMDANDRIESHTVIRNGSATGSGCATSNIALTDGSYFGTSLANIGDFDNDGINELAVGATAGTIYILHLTRDVEVELKCFSTIDFNHINNILGVESSDPDSLDADDGFGVSIANLGDIDGDGIIDLAVGADQDDAQGSVHILFMDKIGNSPALKAAIKIDTSGLGLANDDQFGISVANIGDLDQDRINDLAVGAILNNVPGINDQGAVHVLLLNRNGSIKSEGFEIFDTAGNILNLSAGDRAGRSIANLGDLNGDGINDIAVGALRGDSDTIINTGAVFTIFMRRTDQFIGDDFFIINGTHPDLTLSANDEFGISIANIGDRNGDGISDIAVGAAGTNPGTTGALYILYMDAETVITAVTATADGRHNTGDIINIQVIFSEPVDVDITRGTPTLTLETGRPASAGTAEAVYADGSGSNILTFDYTVVADDLAIELDYVNTAALTLNGGTIIATEAPSSSAILTLPKPGSRGSLSSNRNLLINVPSNVIVEPNTAPATADQILDQTLTVGIPFTYTIPTEAFTDAENDPLIYTLSTSSNWLSLAPDTGTFSGTPPTTQTSTQYGYIVSDAESTITATISITVNAAPTLAAIDVDGQTYLPNESINITLPNANGGTSPITYTLSPVLPDDLMFNNPTDNALARTITSTGAAEHTGQYTYTAEDENGALAAQTFNITIELIRDLNLRIKVFLEGAQ